MFFGLFLHAVTGTGYRFGMQICTKGMNRKLLMQQRIPAVQGIAVYGDQMNTASQDHNGTQPAKEPTAEKI
jgi:hypothetical protein